MASVSFPNIDDVLTGCTWHRMARIATSGRRMSERLLARDNPGLPRRWVEEIVSPLREGDMSVLSARLRQHDHDALVVFGGVRRR